MGLDSKKKNILIFGFIACIIISFASGWFLKGEKFGLKNIQTPLRLGGFKYISPLLVCNTGVEYVDAKFLPLKNSLQETIKQAVSNKTIETASIYYRDLKTGEEIEINGETKFYPASLRKVPLLMALLKDVENNPEYLLKTHVNLSGNDQNKQQEIVPKKSARIGESYSLQDLAEKMILYSDNNSASALTALVGTESLVNLFDKLQVPFVVFNGDFINVDNRDFITAHDYSIFLRVLYNATYLSVPISEQVVDLLTKVDYKNGLVAGVPADVLVAHKFGLLSEMDKRASLVVGRQLHDCGIVYHPKSPYILCVMTKSKAPIAEIEGFIKAVSSVTYEAVDSLSGQGKKG